MTKHFDVIVIGAGIFGSSAAYHAQRLGFKTLLLEQFKLGHTNGSSHGMSRIIRYAHTHPAYIPMVKDAYEQIEQLEKKRGEKLWRKTSLLWASPKSKIDGIADILKGFNIEHEVLPGSKINGRYPHFKFSNKVSGLVDPMGGVLFADKWLNAFQDEFKALGGQIQDEESLKSFKDGNQVKIETNKAAYTSNKLIITVGSWIKLIVPNLPLKVRIESMSVCYWKPKTDASLAENFPVFITKAIPGHCDAFAMPGVDYPGTIKLCNDEGEHIDAGAGHPSNPKPHIVQKPSEYVEKFMPAFDSKPVTVEKCKYTMSEDAHYVLDKLPGSQNIVLGACGSGAGFKVAPCVGRVLAEMAAGKQSSVDVSFFGLKRFQK